MEIKQTRQVRLDELIKHCIENDKFGNEGTFWSSTGKVKVMVYKDDVVIEDDFADCNIIKTLFVITEEVEITEDTKLNVHEIYHYGNNDFNAITHFNISVNKVLNMGMKEPLFIYLQNEDGSIGDLVWSKERGLND